MVFDTGDFLTAIPDSERAEYVIRAMKEVGYDALTAGDQEYLMGRDFFISHFAPYMIKQPTPPGCWTVFSGSEISDYNALGKPILLNLQDSPNRADIRMTRYSKAKRVKIDYTLTGYIDSRAFLFFPEQASGWFKTKSLKETINTNYPECLNILLSHSGEMTDREIAGLFPQIDIIIGGHTQSALEQPVVVGKTLIVQAGGSGRYIGRLDLNLKNGDIADYSYHLVKMTQDMPSDPDISKIVEDYEQAFFKDKKPRPHIAVYPDTLSVIDPSTCNDCHSAQYKQWAGTMHAKAFDIIDRRMKIYNPDCLSCHTTGFGNNKGFITVETTPQWKHIGCTECHWMNAKHLTDPSIKPLPVTEKTCLRCHTNKNSPDFDYNKYLKNIEH